VSTICFPREKSDLVCRFWWINPQDGVAGCYFGQLVPPGDEASLKLFEKFEAAVYKFIGKSVKQETKL